MDNVIDKLLLEWSWRCEKGYPDINNPADKKVLNSILIKHGINISEFFNKPQEVENSVIKEGNVASIQKLLTSKEYDPKLLARIERMLTDSEKVTDLKKLMLDSGINKETFPDRDLPDEIISVLQRGPQSDIENFIKFLKSRKTIKLQLQPGKANIYSSLPKPLQDKVTQIGKITGQSSSVGIGRGEILFPLIFSNVRLKQDNETGDFEVDDKNVEVKALGVKKEGTSAKQGARFGESRTGVPYKPVNQPVKKTAQIHQQIFNDYESSEQQDNKDVVRKNVQEYLKTVYDTEAPLPDPKTEQDVLYGLYNVLISVYARKKNIDYFLLYAPLTGEYSVYTPGDLVENLIKGNVRVTNITNTSAIPQLISFQ
jgi:hypothetical protein